MNATSRFTKSSRAIRRWTVVASLAVSVLVVPGLTGSSVEARGAANLVAKADTLVGSASAYRPINPIRILDTRSDPGIKRLWIGSAFSIDPITTTGVAEAAGVNAADITAVIVNTTLVKTGSRGFGTVWPTGSKRQVTSTNNAGFEGHTIPNLVIAPLGLDQKISVYSSMTSDIILDVLGVFVASPATEAGRFEALGPVRAFDSRDPGTSDFDAGSTQTIDLTPFGVPADATGVVLNVTAIRSKARGFFRVWSAGDSEPAHSSVNVLSENYTAGNQVISGVDAGGIKVFSASGGGLTIDVTGYFTGNSAESTTEGLYVPFSPGRLFDSRATSGPTALNGGKEIGADEAIELQVSGRLGIPNAGAKAVAFNLTGIRATGRGFLKAYPTGAAEPETSSLNYAAADQVVPNHAITSISPSTGQVTLKPSRMTHLAVDASGYFLAEGAVPPAPSSVATATVDPGTFVPAALPASAPVSGPYDFLYDRRSFTQSGVRPVPTIKAAWNSCRALRYALNVDLAQNDAQIAMLIDAIEEMELYTGIDFQFDGVTSAGMNIDDQILLPESFSPELPHKYLPPARNGGDVDLVVGFSNDSDTPEMGGGVIGVGGSIFAGVKTDGSAEPTRGFAVIDLADLIVGEPDSPISLRQIKTTTTHELGHLMGLGHVDTTLNFSQGRGGPGLAPGFSDAIIEDQLMFPSLNPLNTPVFKAGDQRGLHELYANRPCAAKDSLGGSGPLDTDIDWSDAEIVSEY
jgi:hypothetical protein